MTKTIVYIFLIFMSGFSRAAEVQNIYKIEFGSIDIGTMIWTLNNDQEKYISKIILKDRGLLSVLYRFSGEYLSVGYLEKNKFISSSYSQKWQTKKKEKVVKILFEDKKTINIILKPRETEKLRIDFTNFEKTTDPISSMLNIFFSNENNFTTIDGRRVYKMKKVKNKILINDYYNLWADHSRKDLEYIVIERGKNKIGFPERFKIKNKGLVFSLKKINS